MQKINFIVPNELETFINCIMVGQSDDPHSETSIPLYADGYPGIMFQQSQNGFYILPSGKKLSGLLLYGQTVNPASLNVKGSYSYIVFQLYPFASRYLLGVDPKILNDDCFDLLELKHIDVDQYLKKLNNSNNLSERIEIISSLILELVKSNKISPDDRILKAIELIIKQDGKIKIQELLETINITERTFERQFLSQIGLTPKQFARIVQFQRTLHKLTKDDFERLTEVGLDSGFSDQSHFIRTFKQYTGQTPSYYLKEILSN